MVEPKVCMSKMLPGDADTAGQWSTLGVESERS